MHGIDGSPAGSSRRVGARAFAVFGACVFTAATALAFVLPDGEAVLRFTGIALALAFVVALWLLGRGPGAGYVDSAADDSGTALSRWVERTESQIAWADTSRADWDRRLRPMLARQFELATRQPRARNPAAFEAAGRNHFGAELWAWVDPENISRTGTREPGPGRATLADIIERLELL